MGLIIKDKIPALKVGYPTVINRKGVEGGVLSGVANVAFGDTLMYTTTPGQYAKALSLTGVGQVGGFALATNVKLNTVWPGASTVEVLPGEALNVLKKGNIAVLLDDDATANEIIPGARVAIILLTGKLTTIDKAVAGAGIVTLPGAHFTGLKEDLVAEIMVDLI